MSTCWRNIPQSTAFHTFRITVIPWLDGHIIARVTILLMVSDCVRWITTVTSEQIKWFISLISWSVLHIISEIVVEHYQQNLTVTSLTNVILFLFGSTRGKLQLCINVDAWILIEVKISISRGKKFKLKSNEIKLDFFPCSCICYLLISSLRRENTSWTN